MKSWLVALVLGVSLLAGCGGSGGSSTPQASARYFNASPDSGPLDFFVDDDQKAGNLLYLNGSTDFSSVDAAQDKDFSVRPTSGGQDLWTQTFNLGKDQSYVVAAFGQRNYGNEAIKRVQVKPFAFDRTSPNGNKSRLVILNALVQQVGVDPVSIDFQTPEDTPQYKRAAIVYGTVGSLDVDSGTWTFQARLAGSTLSYAENSNTTFGPGKIYLAVVSGVVGALGDTGPKITYIELQKK